jgi:hypothetical protein
MKQKAKNRGYRVDTSVNNFLAELLGVRGEERIASHPTRAHALRHAVAAAGAVLLRDIAPTSRRKFAQSSFASRTLVKKMQQLSCRTRTLRSPPGATFRIAANNASSGRSAGLLFSRESRYWSDPTGTRRRRLAFLSMVLLLPYAPSSPAKLYACFCTVQGFNYFFLCSSQGIPPIRGAPFSTTQKGTARSGNRAA